VLKDEKGRSQGGPRNPSYNRKGTNGSYPPKVESRSRGAKQVEETHQDFGWVERAIWTDRMLKTLVTGVKGGKWFSLMDKVYSKKNLYAAFKRVEKNKGSAGVDHVSVKQFANRLDEEIDRLHQSLKDETYNPQHILRIYIDKPGSSEKRPLGIPSIRDRVVQTALRSVLEPIFEIEFAEQSYGFRPKRGCKDALRRVEELLKNECHWIVDLDFKSYFDTIPHERLIELVGQKVSDSRVIKLLNQFMRQRVLDGMSSWVPEGGTPQGAVVSPLLSNVYLNPLDHLMVDLGFQCVRYADDAVILCKTEVQARIALAALVDWSTQAGLTLHPTKTKLVNFLEPGGFDFLGYHFEVSKRCSPKINKWPSKKSLKKLRSKLLPITKRSNGLSMESIIERMNPILKGWFEYFKHSLPNTFDSMDGWTRMRLRSILRKRRKGRGRGRGIDHQRWPNSYFHDMGLYSTKKVLMSVKRSSSR